MDNIEKRKRQLELGRVRLAKDEMEIRIAEREAEIARIKDSIKVQEDKIKEIEKNLEKG